MWFLGALALWKDNMAMVLRLVQKEHPSDATMASAVVGKHRCIPM